MKKTKHIGTYLILGLWALIIIGMIGWVLNNSFKTNLEIYQNPWGLPSVATLENYESAWGTMQMSKYFTNSVLIVFSSVFGSLVLSSLAAYALTRFEFFGRKLLLSVLIF